MNITDILHTTHLPAADIAEAVNEALSTHTQLVVTAPPGAGKSTLLPLTILNALKEGGRVLMLEPRRLAARQIAERMATLLAEPVGQTVGYRVRFDKRVSAATRIEVLTEGILTRMLVADATLDGVSVVIFDEFHERSINTDLALALTRAAQQIIRPDLRIVIMSATIDTTTLCHTLQAPLISCQGRMYDVQTYYADHDTAPRDMAQAVAATVARAHRLHEGDILAFLPGQAEINQCAQLLADTLAPTEVYPLYGQLSPELQRRAIAPSPPGRRKVVLATPIAETSITIEGVRIVVDSGLCRALVFDPRTGLSHLATTRISLDMAMQRAGRAGRVAAGVCYRMWAKASEHLMAAHRKPEIEEADLAPMVLDVAAFGESQVAALPWITPPPMGNIARAQQLLRLLGAIDTQGTITPQGRAMAVLPCHPRIARMILGGATAQLKALACDIAALLEEKDPMGDEAGTDLPLRISVLRGKRARSLTGRWARIGQIAHEYRCMAHVVEDNTAVDPQEVGLLVAYAYPERIAMATDGIGTYRLAGGQTVRIDHTDSMSAHTWLSIASLHTGQGDGRVFLAAPLEPGKLMGTSLVTEHSNLSWNSKQNGVVARREWRIGQLLIDSKPLTDVDPQEVIRVVCEAVKHEGLSLLDWNDRVSQLQRRVAAVSAWHPELAIPCLTTDHLLATADSWLPFYLEQGGRLLCTLGDLKRINLSEVLWALIPYELQQDIDRLAPSHIQVPTGSQIRVDYRRGAEAPVLSVRLQECFGLERTPCVDNGHRPVLMELLSPGFKPVQMTQDLQSFWQNTYFEVRKELRRRYPKHYWPDNPLEAQAVRGVRRT